MPLKKLSYEKPQHKVYLDACWIDQTPITNAMYARFLNECGNQSEENASWYKPASGRLKPDGNVWRVDHGFEQHPVVSVTWYGARAYAAWVEAELPSEAQWKKAARGADGRRYPWGDQLPDKTLANYGGDWSAIPAVGSYPAGASPYGALDMAGNVWQWTRSLWGTDKARPDYGYPYDPRDPRREHLDAPRKVTGFCGVVPGTAVTGSPAAPSAIITLPTNGTGSSVFGSPSALHPDLDC